MGVAEERAQTQSVAVSQIQARLSAALIAKHRQHLVSVATNIVQPLEHQDHGRIAALLSIRWQAGGCGRHVHRLGRQVHRGHQRSVDLTVLQRPPRDLQGANAGELLGGYAETGPAEIELTVQAVADDVGHGPDHARRTKQRHECLARCRHPILRRTQCLGPARHAPARPVARDLGIALHAHQDRGSLARQGRCHLFHCLASRGQHEQLLGQRLFQILGGEAQAFQRERHLVGRRAVAVQLRLPQEKRFGEIGHALAIGDPCADGDDAHPGMCAPLSPTLSPLRGARAWAMPLRRSDARCCRRNQRR